MSIYTKNEYKFTFIDCENRKYYFYEYGDELQEALKNFNYAKHGMNYSWLECVRLYRDKDGEFNCGD